MIRPLTHSLSGASIYKLLVEEEDLMKKTSEVTNGDVEREPENCRVRPVYEKGDSKTVSASEGPLKSSLRKGFFKDEVVNGFERLSKISRSLS